MNKFTKGLSYIVSSGGLKYKYIVHQTGMKSWRASIFSHVVTEKHLYNYVVIEGNAFTLYEKLKEVMNVTEGVVFDVRAYNTDSGLRKDMFDILMYGYFKD